MTDYLRNYLNSEYLGAGNRFFNCDNLPQIEESESGWVDFIANGGRIITDDNSWFNGFQKMKDGRYCFFGTNAYGQPIYKVF